MQPPSGCHFHTRCPYAFARCVDEAPQLREVAPGRFKACLRDDLAMIDPMTNDGDAPPPMNARPEGALE